MRNLVIWNVIVAAVLGGVFGALVHLLVGRGGAGRTAFKTIGIILLTGATTPYVAPALRSVAAPIFPKSRVEHDCWAVRTMDHYLPQLLDESRRDLSRAVFTS